MIFKKNLSSEKENKAGTYKLCNMLSYLKQTTSEFETIADSVEDKDFKMALRGIAVQARQYANELDSQLKCMDVYYLSPFTHFKRDEISILAYQINTDKSKKNVSAICDQSESFFTTAYQDILNIDFRYPFLKNIIHSQFNGICSAFKQMRLLNMMKFN
jgi:hypothetical protein